jgi:predicted dehydrogenase
MKMVLVGLGMVADTYVRAFADTTTGATLHGVFARRPAARAAFADRAAGALGARPREYASIAEILADPEAEGIVIATPPDARRDLVEAFAAAGKPMLMEKPIERDTAAAAALVAACERAGTPLGMMLQNRARPPFQTARRRLARGEFGAVGLVSISVPWWRPQSYYDELGRGTYARDGGGVLISQAIHMLDLALWLAGPAKAATALARTSAFHRMEAEDFVAGGLEFARGAFGALVASTAEFPGATESVSIQTEAAALLLRSGQLEIAWRDGRCETFGEASGSGSGADPMAFPHAFHQAVIEDFVAAVAEGRPPLATGRSVLDVHRLIDAITASSREGRRVLLEEIAA